MSLGSVREISMSVGIKQVRRGEGKTVGADYLIRRLDRAWDIRKGL